MKLLLLVLISTLSLVSGQIRDQPRNPRLLGCERMQGNFNNMHTLFRRPMQVGDRLVVNGVVGQNSNVVRMNINTLVPQAISIQLKNLIGDKMVYNTYMNGKWNKEEHAPRILNRGQAFTWAIEYTGGLFNVYLGSTLIRKYPLKTPRSYELSATTLSGEYTTNWIEMVCKNPPRPGNGGGNGNGGGGGHGHGGSSSSSEEC